MDLDLLKPQFSQHDVAEATGIPVGRIRNWVARGLLKYTDFDQVAGRGASHLLSAQTAIRVALIDEMTALISVDAASAAALQFGTSGAGSHPNAVATRSVGGLFEEGETFIFVYPDGKSEIGCRLSNGSFYPHMPAVKMMIQPVDDVWHRITERLTRMPKRRAAADLAPPSKEKVDA